MADCKKSTGYTGYVMVKEILKSYWLVIFFCRKHLSQSNSSSSGSGALQRMLTAVTGVTRSSSVTTAVMAQATCSKAPSRVVAKPRTPTSAWCGKCSHPATSLLCALVGGFMPIFLVAVPRQENGVCLITYMPKRRVLPVVDLDLAQQKRVAKAGQIK